MSEFAIQRVDKDLSPDNTQDELNDYERALMRKMFKAWLQWPKEAKLNILDHVALNGRLSIGQIVGFLSFVPSTGTTINTAEATGSATYVDLATVGPTITGLPDGEYLVWFGAEEGVAGAAGGRMSVQVNASAATDDDSIIFNALTSTSRGILVTLDNGDNNTLTAKYRSTISPASRGFQRRWMFATKYRNP